MALLDEQGFPHEGQLDFVDNRLNPQTGAILIVGFVLASVLGIYVAWSILRSGRP